MKKSKNSALRLAVCVKNMGYAVQDHLFPRTSFIPIKLPQPVRKAVLTAA